jgi:hypothetical protein
MVRRLPVQDEVVDGEESVVLVDGRVLVLSPVATTILSLIGQDCVSLSRIVEGLVTAFGDPDGNVGIVAMTESALHDLCCEGLVNLGP